MSKHIMDDYYGLDPQQMQVLATYNSEVCRGIMHTIEWKNKMLDLQTIYNKAIERENVEFSKYFAEINQPNE